MQQSLWNTERYDQPEKATSWLTIFKTINNGRLSNVIIEFLHFFSAVIFKPPSNFTILFVWLYHFAVFVFQRNNHGLNRFSDVMILILNK